MQAVTKQKQGRKKKTAPAPSQGTPSATPTAGTARTTPASEASHTPRHRRVAEDSTPPPGLRTNVQSTSTTPAFSPDVEPVRRSSAGVGARRVSEARAAAAVPFKDMVAQRERERERAQPEPKARPRPPQRREKRDEASGTHSHRYQARVRDKGGYEPQWGNRDDVMLKTGRRLPVSLGACSGSYRAQLGGSLAGAARRLLV